MNEETMRSMGIEERATRTLRQFGYGPALLTTMNPEEIQRFADVADEHGKFPDPAGAHGKWKEAINEYHEARKAVVDEPAKMSETNREDT